MTDFCNCRPHFNGLTTAQAERLAMLAEECGEVIQAVSKILRHGYNSAHPDRPFITNHELLANELTDLSAVLGRIVLVEKLPFGDVEKAWSKKMIYAHHQLEDAPND